jgi:transposase-like protein
MPANQTVAQSIISPKQRRAIEALLTTGDVQAAAQQVGVSRDSLYRWLKQPVFIEAVRAAEAQAIDDLSRLLVRLGRTASGTLAKAMSDATTPVAAKIRAADIVLNRLLQLRELATLEARVVELERSAGLREDG